MAVSSSLKQGNATLRTSPVWLALTLATVFVGVSIASIYEANKNVKVLDKAVWESDLWNAPSSVPFPGKSWLDRVMSTEFQYQGQTFASAYASMLPENPLDAPCRNFNAYINSFIIPDSIAAVVVRKFGTEWGHYVLCYLRDFVGAMIVYYGTAGLFHYFCYVHSQSKDIFENSQRKRPSNAIMWDQIQLAQASMILYVFLPVVDEYFVEQGWTKAYFTIDEIGGWQNYIMTMLAYFASVEVGIYWMHRKLHTNKWLYKHVHMMHHQYNKPETLTPWASIAFHPLDGILQASPYVVCMFLLPCHYLTHFGLLFFTAIWATYIHDAMDFNIDPIMGSKYHTVHHTHYIYNYGQVFTFCDRIWGTLRTPQVQTGVPYPQKLK